MESPSPGLAHRATGHRLEGTRFADRAQINVDEDSPQHDQRRNVVQNVADGNGPASKSPGACPENDASDQVDRAAGYDLPELYFLPGIEESCIRRLELVFSGNDSFNIAHPVGVGLRPSHGFQPVQHLQSEKDDESKT